MASEVIDGIDTLNFDQKISTDPPSMLSGSSINGLYVMITHGSNSKIRFFREFYFENVDFNVPKVLPVPQNVGKIFISTFLGQQSRIYLVFL